MDQVLEGLSKSTWALIPGKVPNERPSYDCRQSCREGFCGLCLSRLCPLFLVSEKQDTIVMLQIARIAACT